MTTMKSPRENIVEEMKIFSNMRKYIDAVASSASIAGKMVWIHQVDMACRDPDMNCEGFGEKPDEGFATFDLITTGDFDDPVGFPRCWLYPIKPIDDEYDPFVPLFEEHLDDIQAEFNLV